MKTIDAVAALSALAQENRLDVFRLLVQAGPQGLPAGQVAERLELAGPTLSFHLAQLRHAGLVVARRQGRSIIYAADFAAMNRVLEFLTQNCCAGGACAPARDAIENQGDRDESPARSRRG
jgi:DNA-binding transcriptional ArsR family regulator